MTAEHNHPPRCCCPRIPDTSNPNPGRWIANPDNPCPACITHGELAPGIECPQCHTQIGQPHTDYCTLAPGRVWDGLLPEATPSPDDEEVFAEPLGGRHVAAGTRYDPPGNTVPHPFTPPPAPDAPNCPTCNGRVWINGRWMPRRETAGLVCQTCGTDYSQP